MEGKAVKFALIALNEFNSNTNFYTGITVFFKKCGNSKWRARKEMLGWYILHKLISKFS
jgi:hypothetical protein